MKAKRYLLSTSILLLLYFIVYLSVYRFQIGALVKSEKWVNDVNQYRDFRSKKIKQQKLIIISGSNSMFGIDSDLISNKLKIPVLNLASHASLDIDYLYYQLKRHIGKNDIVIMPLEYIIYNRNGISDWFANNMLVWGTDYISSLRFYDALKFILNTNPSRVFHGALMMIREGRYKELPQEKIASELEALISSDGIKWRGYSYKSLNMNGDINVDMRNNGKRKPGKYISDKEISSHFLEGYNKIMDLVKLYDGKLIITPPVTFRNDLYNLENHSHQENVIRFTNKLAQHNIYLQCNPALFHLGKVFMFDTVDHTNKYGAIVRSENLADCIQGILAEGSYDLSFAESLKKTMESEKKYFSQIASIDSHENRLSDLIKIKSALNSYFIHNKSYPKSLGFDGRYTKWGYSGADWIKGLSTEYIQELPSDPRNTTDPSKQYLYKSDGRDFKLIAHQPDDCIDVKQSHPETIDPKRNCWAYGFWTEGGKNW